MTGYVMVCHCFGSIKIETDVWSIEHLAINTYKGILIKISPFLLWNNIQIIVFGVVESYLLKLSEIPATRRLLDNLSGAKTNRSAVLFTEYATSTVQADTKHTKHEVPSDVWWCMKKVNASNKMADIFLNEFCWMKIIVFLLNISLIFVPKG